MPVLSDDLGRAGTHLREGCDWVSEAWRLHVPGRAGARTVSSSLSCQSLRAAITASIHRVAARLRHGTRRTAVRRHPAIDGGKDLASAAVSKLRAGGLAAGARPSPVRRVAPGSSPGAPAGPALTPSARGAEPAPNHRQRTRGPGQRTRLRGGSAGWDDQRGHLQMRQQPLGGMASRRAGWWPAGKSHRTYPAGICPGDRLANTFHRLESCVLCDNQPAAARCVAYASRQLSKPTGTCMHLLSEWKQLWPAPGRLAVLRPGPARNLAIVLLGLLVSSADRA